MSIQRRGWAWLAGTALLALVAVMAVRWALSSPGRGADDRREATELAQAEATAVARAVAATLTADAEALSASSDATPEPSATGSDAPDLSSTATALAAAATLPAPTARPPIASATSAPPTSASPTAEPPTAAPTDGVDLSGTQWIGEQASGGSVGDIWRLVDTRLGRHEGFTRVVWEFQADVAAPRWRVVQRDMSGGAPATWPEGAISGSAWLEVVFTDVIAMEAPQALDYQPSPGGPVLTGVTMLRPPVGEEDDSSLGFVVGLARPTRFQAQSLDAPARLVLDVYDRP